MRSRCWSKTRSRRRRRRARDLARPDQGVRPRTGGRSRTRSSSTRRTRSASTERADDSDASEGQSSGSVVAAASRERALREGVRNARRRRARDQRKPRAAAVVLFYATDDDVPPEDRRLIRAAGFEPLEVGGVAAADRIEGPDGELSQGGFNGALLISTRRGPPSRPRRCRHERDRDIHAPRLRPCPKVGARPGAQRAGLLRRPRRAEPLLGHRRHLPVRVPDDVGRRRRARRAADDRRHIQRAIDEIAAANGVSNKVKYLIYSHHHSDHVGAASLFDKNVTRIGHEETRRLLLRDDDPARPPNEETFQDRRTLEIGGERIDLA